MVGDDYDQSHVIIRGGGCCRKGETPIRDEEIFETDLQKIVADLEGEVFGETEEAAIEAGEFDGLGELDEILAGKVGGRSVKHFSCSAAD